MARFSFIRIYREATKKELLTLIIFALMMMVSSIAITGIPLLFIEPKTLCKTINGVFKIK